MYGARRFFPSNRSGRDDFTDVHRPDEREEGTKDTERSQESTDEWYEIDFHEIIWETYFPKAIAMGVSYTEFKHLNPYKLSLAHKGVEMRRKIRDEEMGMWFGSYGRAVIAMGVREGAWGKGKLDYPNEPILNKKETTEDDLKKQRELFVTGLMAMQTNFELNHPKVVEKETINEDC